jgi:hypothetical protein
MIYSNTQHMYGMSANLPTCNTRLLITRNVTTLKASLTFIRLTNQCTVHFPLLLLTPLSNHITLQQITNKCTLLVLKLPFRAFVQSFQAVFSLATSPRAKLVQCNTVLLPEVLVLGFTMLLRLKACYSCDGISVVAEFMVDAAEVKALLFVRRHQRSGRVHG